MSSTNFPHPFQVGTTVYAQQYGEGEVTDVAPNADHPELGIVTVNFPAFDDDRGQYSDPTFWVTGVEVAGLHPLPTLSLHRNWSTPTTTVKIIPGTIVVATAPAGHPFVGFYCDRKTEGTTAAHYVVPMNTSHPNLEECFEIIEVIESPELVKQFPDHVALAIKSTADNYNDIPF